MTFGCSSREASRARRHLPESWRLVPRRRALAKRGERQIVAALVAPPADRPSRATPAPAWIGANLCYRAEAVASPPRNSHRENRSRGARRARWHPSTHAPHARMTALGAVLRSAPSGTGRPAIPRARGSPAGRSPGSSSRKAVSSVSTFRSSARLSASRASLRILDDLDSKTAWRSASVASMLGEHERASR